WRNTTADANGMFSFNNIRAGNGLNYALTVAKLWHTSSPAVAVPGGINNQTVNLALTHQAFAINGLVSTLDFGSSLPVPDISVRLLLGTSVQQTVQTGTQAPNKGMYRFEGVPAGRQYSVQPAHLYYRFTPQTSSIPLLGGNTEVNFQASRITRKLTVQVVDDAASAQPLSGVTVTLSRKDGLEAPKEGVTGENGKYVFDGLKTGRDYTVSFAKQYYRFFPPTLDTPPNVATAADLSDITLGSTAQRIKHTISGAIMVAAFLRQPAYPAAGVRLNMLLNGVRSTVVYQTMDDGTYIMSQPEGWGYTIEPSHDYFTFEPPTLILGTLLQDLPNQNFVAKRKKFAVTGQVKDSGGRAVRDVTVRATWKSSDANIGTTSTSQTNSGGNYNMTETLAGVYYSIEVLTPANSTGFHVEPYIIYTEPVLTAPKENVNFVAGYQINGRLTDVRGNPLSGVKLTVTDSTNTGTALVAQTDAGGNYLIKHLAPGFSYVVTPAKDGMHFDRASQAVNNLSNSVQVDFVGGHHISGHIEDNFTTPRLPLPGVKVVLQCTPSLPPQFVETEQITDEHGMYYFATLFPPGSTCTATPSKQGFTFDPPSRSKSDLNYNQPFGFVGGYSISGKVTAGNGKSMTGVEVTLSRSRADGPPLQVKIITDAAGEYAFKYLAAGQYTLKAAGAGVSFLPATLAIDNLSGDQIQNFKEVLTISGKVTFGETRIVMPDVEVQLRTNPLAAIGRARGVLAPPISTRTDASGRYSFTVESPSATYTITPTSDKHTFEPQSRTLNGIQVSQVVDFATATTTPPPVDATKPPLL
ncbi:MAG: carboxypeptidase regulatory-like domain-containing protein, partial [Pyrinomonadaceae bacterium]